MIGKKYIDIYAIAKALIPWVIISVVIILHSLVIIKTTRVTIDRHSLI